MTQLRHAGPVTTLVVILGFGWIAASALGQTSQHAPAIHSPLNNSAMNNRCPAHEDAMAALGKASALLAQGQYEDAAAALKALVESSCDPRAALLYAATFDARGDAGGATAALEHAHRHWPANDSVAASLAHQYMNAQQPAKAADALRYFTATRTTPQQELEVATLVDFATHQLPAAKMVASIAWGAYPSLHTLLLYANALQLEGRYPDVNRLLAPKRETYAESPEFFMTLAESESDASVYADALSDLSRALALEPKSSIAHYLLGYVKLRMNDTDAAITELRTSIELGSTQPRTYYQLALALRNKQDDAGEEQALQQALAADAHYAPAQCELGRILLDEHKPTEAVSHLAQAVEFNPRSEQGYFLLARAYAALGDKAKSGEMAKRLVEVRAQNRATAKNKAEPLSQEN
jgi:predicted Zn-dependent protease